MNLREALRYVKSNPESGQSVAYFYRRQREYGVYHLHHINDDKWSILDLRAINYPHLDDGIEDSFGGADYDELIADLLSNNQHTLHEIECFRFKIYAINPSDFASETFDMLAYKSFPDLPNPVGHNYSPFHFESKLRTLITPLG